MIAIDPESIERRIKLQDLRLFIAVVETGSMGRAARRLNTSQPNISRAIADLERTIGVRLLERHPQGTGATEYGRALLECGAAVFDDIRHALKKIAFLADESGGHVRLGSPPPIAETFASAVIERLSRRHPRMMFELRAMETGPLYRGLAERQLDLLIARRVGPEDGGRFSFEPLYQDFYVVVAGARSRWARRRKVTLNELANEAWVLPPPDALVGAAAREAFRAGGIDVPNVTVSTVPREVRTRLVATGRFLTIVPSSALRFLFRRSEIKVLPIRLQTVPAPVGIVTVKNRPLSPVAERFAREARELAERPSGKELNGLVAI